MIHWNRFLSLALILAVPPLVAQAGAPRPESGGVALIGDWRGESVCLVKPSACHDEEALYHISALPSSPGRFSMRGDKIVNGKPEFMGTLECGFDERAGILHCDFAKGFLNLALSHNRLQGSMYLPDKTRWRDISLTKVKP